MDIQYGNPIQLNWFWLVPLCIAVAIFAIVATRRARRMFATENLAARVLPPATSGHMIASTILVTSTIAMMALALVDIRWGLSLIHI